MQRVSFIMHCILFRPRFTMWRGIKRCLELFSIFYEVSSFPRKYVISSWCTSTWLLLKWFDFDELQLSPLGDKRTSALPAWHSVSLFTGQECPKISMTSNPRQNCRIGQPFTKKWFFSPDQFGLRRKRKGKSGEIRSLLETLGSTL